MTCCNACGSGCDDLAAEPWAVAAWAVVGDEAVGFSAGFGFVSE